LHSNKLSFMPAVYFDRSLDQGFLPDPPGGGSDTLAAATQHVLGLVESGSLAAATNSASRVWFIVFQKEIDEYTSSGLAVDPDLDWLGGIFHLGHVETWGPLRLYIYQR
jgi:hypothetical protein